MMAPTAEPTAVQPGPAKLMISLNEALDLAEGRLSEESISAGHQITSKIENRLGHGTNHTLVALLGATGGGKSSLTNAVVGAEVAVAGFRRPTTSATLACYWGDDDPQPLLDWLDVLHRHQVSGSQRLDGLVLLDVPDHDSIETDHRLEMERIAANADLLVWVTDPEKYGDAAMHQYLRGLPDHGAVTALVLNKADQLSRNELDHCRNDLARLLADDGLDGVPIIATTTVGGSAGVDGLVDLLAGAVSERRAMIKRLEADTVAIASVLLQEVGVEPGPADVTSSVVTELTADLVDAAGLVPVIDAVERGYRRDAAVTTGWPFTRYLRQLRPRPLRRLHLGAGSQGRTSLPTPAGGRRTRTDGAVRTAVANATADLPQPWPDLVAATVPAGSELHDRLDLAIANPVRSRSDPPRWWRVVNTAQQVLAAATVMGLLWLAALALAAYFRLPDIPTPGYRQVPLPTALALGGGVGGLLLAAGARRPAAVGAGRRGRRVRAEAAAAVGEVAEELVIAPIRAELERREQLRRLLIAAGARQ